MSDDCIFCKLIAGHLPSHRLGENAGAFAFLDIHPLVDGHAMVIPKRHHDRFESLSDDEAGQVFALAREVSRAQLDELGAEATTIGINNGPAAGQLVGHMHVHVIPRYETDDGGSVHAIVRGESSVDLATMATRLAARVAASH